MKFIVTVGFLIIVLLGCLIPAWLGLLVYDYIAHQVGWVVLDVTFLNVLAVSVVIWLLGIVV